MKINIRKITCLIFFFFCLNLCQALTVFIPYNLRNQISGNHNIDSLPNAGIISISNRQICPRDIQEILVENYNPSLNQFILIATKEGKIIQAKRGYQWYYAFPECGSYQLVSFNTKTNVELDLLNDKTISDITLENCMCEISILNIDVKYSSAPVFDVKPSDITVDCILSPLSYNEGLPYTNPCGKKGLAPLISKSKNPCDYGLNSRVWQINDGCGFELYHIQKITNKYGNLSPFFINPPANITIDCNRNEIVIPDLVVTNNAQYCNINISLPPKVESHSSPCGGTITAIWSYTNECNQKITHLQNITKIPMSKASFINPPIDITLSCGMKPFIDSLAYSNGSSECTLQGKVPPQIKGDPSKCEPTTITWQFTDECQRTITHQQSISWSTNQIKATEKRAYLHANEVKPQKEIPVVWK